MASRSATVGKSAQRDKRKTVAVGAVVVEESNEAEVVEGEKKMRISK